MNTKTKSSLLRDAPREPRRSIRSGSLEKSDPALRHDDVARRARELWESYGKPAGRDEEIWLEAERETRRL